jgi:hypothetical protein
LVEADMMDKTGSDKWDRVGKSKVGFFDNFKDEGIWIWIVSLGSFHNK